MATKILQVVDNLVKNADTLDGKHADEFATAEIVGSLSDLTTTAQDTVVNAINELNADGSVDLAKLGDDIIDSTVGINLFNPENVLNLSINGSTLVLTASSSCRTGYIKCKPNTTYSFCRTGTLGSRFMCGCLTQFPEAGMVVTKYMSRNWLSTFEYTTDETAEYLVFYFYIAKYDTVEDTGNIPPETYAANTMVAEGAGITEFEEYNSNTKTLKKSLLPIEYQDVPEDVEELQLTTTILESEVTALQNTINFNTRFNSRNKIYGVMFDTTGTSTRGGRIADAEYLNTNYVVGETFQNDGVNDFDGIYPWCDIRRCNLSVDANGKKKIVYEGETGFSTDSSNGNVMVEIPKFYTFREIRDGSETWAITGEPKSGFTVEPAFIDNNGNELDFIYVGAYEFSGTSTTDWHSISGAPVKTKSTMATYRNIAKLINMTCIDYATIRALQFLWVVEFADRDTDKYMQGYSHAPWFASSNSPITAITEDRLTVTVDYSGERTKNLRAGQNVIICQNSTAIQSNLEITAIVVSDDETTADITFDVAVTSNITDFSTGDYYVSGMAQNTGKCDGLLYHTGRIGEESDLSPFRYRYIENIWGNAWAMLEGIRIKELNYYYTYDTSHYADETVDEWKKSNLVAPNQPYLGDDGNNRAWISEMGFDVNDRQLVLPTACSSDGTTDTYYSSALYTLYDADRYGTALDTTKEYICVYGGGYDHNTLCGLFTMRFWWSVGTGEQQALHTSRLVYRGEAYKAIEPDSVLTESDKEEIATMVTESIDTEMMAVLGTDA